MRPASSPVTVVLKRAQRQVTVTPRRFDIGYIVINPVSLAEEYPPVDFDTARRRVHEIGGAHATYRII